MKQNSQAFAVTTEDAKNDASTAISTIDFNANQELASAKATLDTTATEAQGAFSEL